MFCHNKPLLPTRSEGLGHLVHSVYRRHLCQAPHTWHGKMRYQETSLARLMVPKS